MKLAVRLGSVINCSVACSLATVAHLALTRCKLLATNRAKDVFVINICE
jgi:hypothetical protein